MGRTEASVAQPPQATRKAARAKLAKDTLNRTIPALLASYLRAKRGSDSAELIVQPTPPDNNNTTAMGISSLRIRLVNTDTITAAQQLSLSDRPNKKAGSDAGTIAILNMASPLRPGSGFLQGATSQEEFLCMRTTLLPSLRDEFYRLPEVGGVHTPDVLVFRDGEGADLPKKDRFFIDVVSAGMLRFPDLEEGGRRYANAADRQLVEAKMEAVMKICAVKKAARVVLGAWGCGAYGNPVEEIAGAWRKVLLKDKGRRKRDSTAETWPGIAEVVFAITDRKMYEGFRQHFEDVLQVHEHPPEKPGPREDVDEGVLSEIDQKVAELEAQLQGVKSDALRERIQSVVDSLRARSGP
ncbi:hypothetical protein PUNSTDRAFT_135510 [Punctularia strigosozonata HHB-11173 SS5]|uniref:uncharacterized protein n=1 Tax=Punctularia strigosozonata (strain HHB-11173) TaxID=741275 RepID=UPI00044177D1|nr:uncharacterized protein PUNSTDRAFT_135510 [Punctularia strigosozonata HHB-11173 SS5]EIN07993.1 hypothetical protein PUNSTDRAFT_135510 [Punctularia strigosozonata HHB-11173 SS5]